MLRQSPDVHMKNGIACIQCHEPNRESGHHGDLRRDGDCSKCHARELKAQVKGTHRNVDCAACHVSVIGGYAFNFWTVRKDIDGDNPITRLQGYYVNAIPPLIVKNPKGSWIPVHVVPHTAGNVIEKEVSLSKKLLFRNSPDTTVQRRYFSNDSLAVTGFVRDVDDQDGGVMTWLNADRVSHGIGKARPCEGCHASSAQTIPVKYESAGDSYKDVEDGEYTIIADENSLRVTDFRGADGAKGPKGLEPFRDLWTLKGNFSLPAIRNKGLYEKMSGDFRSGRFAHE